MPKRSRLEVKKTLVRFSNGKKQNGGHLKTGPKNCPKNDRSKTGQPGFQMVTVFSFMYKMVEASRPFKIPDRK
jgi:hypothetical protein